MMWMPHYPVYAGAYPSSDQWFYSQDSSWQHPSCQEAAGSGQGSKTSKRQRRPHGPIPAVAGEDARRQSHAGQAQANERVAAAKKPSKEPPDSLGDRRQELEKELKGENREKALEFLRGQIWSLAKQPSGSRLVQAAFSNSVSRTERDLVRELEGHVCEAISDAHANYVLQRAIEVFHYDDIEFISKELQGLGYKVACHRYGCRIMVQLGRQCNQHDTVKKLFDGALEEATELCRHAFGRHVAENILDFGAEEQRLKVKQALRESPLESATDRHASYVVERVLRDSEGSSEELAGELLGKDLCSVKALVQSPFGFYVLRTLLNNRSEEAQRPVLEHLKGLLKTDGQDKDTSAAVVRLLEDLGKGPSAAAEAAAEG